MEKNKICVRCNKNKPFSEFHRPLELNSWCKECYVDYKHKYYINHKEQLREKHKLKYPPKPKPQLLLVI